MHKQPFRFIDSPKAVQELHGTLAKVGLVGEPPSEPDVEANPYHPACWLFTCRWLTRPVELHWHFGWWPDGHLFELSRISVLHEGAVVGEVNVDELLRQRLTRPLVQVIVEELAAICGQLTKRKLRK